MTIYEASRDIMYSVIMMKLLGYEDTLSERQFTMPSIDPGLVHAFVPISYPNSYKSLLKGYDLIQAVLLKSII